MLGTSEALYLPIAIVTSVRNALQLHTCVRIIIKQTDIWYMMIRNMKTTPGRRRFVLTTFSADVFMHRIIIYYICICTHLYVLVC